MNTENKESPLKSENLFLFAWNHRKVIGVVCMIALMLSIVVAYLIPPKYKATTVLFATQNNNLSSALISEQPFASKDFLAFGEERDCEQMLQVIKSEDVMYALAKKYNLYDYYGLTQRADKNTLLKSYYDDLFTYEITEYQSIKIMVYDKSPVMAAKMANDVVLIADSVYRAILGQRAQAALRIVKGQYDSACAYVNKLEDSLNFYRKQGLLSYDYQVKELTKGYADAENHGSAAAIKIMEDKLKPFEQYGQGYWYLMNTLEEHFKWLQTMKQSYIAAKVNAEQYVSPFFIANKASVPDKNTYPVKWLIVFVSVFAAFFFSLTGLLLSKQITAVFSTIKSTPKS
jgi:capsular polysaccharide biosynthesis protein